MLAFIQTSQPQIDDESADSTRMELNTILPVKTVEEFLQYDRIIADCDGKRNSLKRLITSWIEGSGDLKAALNRTMPAVISKNVQILYSGCGRKTKNQQRLHSRAFAMFFRISSVTKNRTFISPSSPI